MGGLATLLEGAGYTLKIFECDFQTFILLWWKVCVKLDFDIENVIKSVSASVLVHNLGQFAYICGDFSLLTFTKNYAKWKNLPWLQNINRYKVVKN